MGDRGLSNRLTCALCGVDADPLRDRACVVNGQVKTICQTCAAGNTTHPVESSQSRAGSSRPREAGVLAHGDGAGDPVRVAVRQGTCNGCGAAVELHRLRTLITAGGSIESRCPACTGEQASENAQEAEAELICVAPRRSWRRYVLAAMAAGGLAVALAGASDRVPSPTAAVAHSFAPEALAASHDEGPNFYPRPTPATIDAEPLGASSNEVVDGVMAGAGADEGGQPDGDETDGEYPGDELEDPGVFEDGELPPTIEDMLENSEEALEERLPTLLDWVYPVAGSDESFPLRATRRFGARREGVRRNDCGRGHCGVDLDGPRGAPVVAVAWGRVTRIERRSNRRSGKYVRIEHPDYVYTSYMHLDSIAEGLAIGDEVQPGQVVGTLGRTGIRHSAAHLHFSLEIPAGERFMHLDPAPYLGGAARIEEPELGGGE